MKFPSITATWPSIFDVLLCNITSIISTMSRDTDDFATDSAFSKIFNTRSKDIIDNVGILFNRELVCNCSG